MPEPDLVKTGIKGLDDVLFGGIPRGNITLVAGTAGSGKTTLGVEFVYRGASQFNEPGMIVLFEVAPDKLIRDAALFGWDLRALERDGRSVGNDGLSAVVAGWTPHRRRRPQRPVPASRATGAVASSRVHRRCPSADNSRRRGLSVNLSPRPASLSDACYKQIRVNRDVRRSGLIGHPTPGGSYPGRRSVDKRLAVGLCVDHN